MADSTKYLLVEHLAKVMVLSKYYENGNCNLHKYLPQHIRCNKLS